MRHVVAKGHETESRRGSGRGEVTGESRYLGTYDSSYNTGYRQPPSYGSSGGEEMYYEEESPYHYDYDHTGDNSHYHQSR
jgi:hypothetical protein